MEPSPQISLPDLPSVTSAKAADIVGVGYEGFRSYLKRGILGRTSMLPGFHAPGTATSDDPTPRAKPGWKTFGFADLCLMRTAKVLIDAGFSFNSANGIVSSHRLWSCLQHDVEPVDRYLMIWPPYGDHILFEPHDMVHLPGRLGEAGAAAIVTLVNLGDVQRHVRDRLVSAPGESQA
jgi:hypothetical protein